MENRQSAEQMRDPSAITAAPRVTVIIPTYNWSSVLPYSIGSVLRQSFTDFELLVVGDGCTDDSEQVVTAITDPRLRWINLPVNDGHQSAPNNEGLRQARGSIIAYLGHDDLWLPHHLEVMVAAIDAGADVAHSIVHMIGAEGNILPPAGGNDPVPARSMAGANRRGASADRRRKSRRLAGLPQSFHKPGIGSLAPHATGGICIPIRVPAHGREIPRQLAQGHLQEAIEPRTAAVD